MPANLWSQVNGDVLVVQFSDGKLLEDAKIQQIGQELLELVRRAESQKMVLNFQNVQFMSSAMIGKLVQTQKKCKEDSVVLKCCNIAPKIMEVFKITNLNKLFEIHGDEAAAIKSFEKKGWF